MESPYPASLWHEINLADCGGNKYSDNISAPDLMIVLQRTNSASMQLPLPHGWGVSTIAAAVT
jgi:hypothetical protein